jgi:hypothetical protein
MATTSAQLQAAYDALYPDGKFQYDRDLLNAWFAAFRSYRPTDYDKDMDRVTNLKMQVTKDKRAWEAAAAAPAGGRRKTFKKKRLMSKKYCKKTPCRRMGFTQKASCRPYKNCYQ